MRFSLVVATLGRDREVAAFLESVRNQGRNDLEVVVVDQNDDDRLGPILDDFRASFPTRRERSTVRQSSHARNLGLRLSRGEIVAFPDDDCLYPPGLLDRVDNAFARDEKLVVLTGPALSLEGDLGSGRWRKRGGTIDIRNVWTSVIEFNLFVRRSVADAIGGFDCKLGVGSKYGSAEGNDFVLRALQLGGHGIYDPQLRVIHPDKQLTPVAVERAYRYGTGLGFVMHRHAVPLDILLTFLIRPAGGWLLVLIRLRSLQAAYHWHTLRGRWHGYLCGAAERNKARPHGLVPGQLE